MATKQAILDGRIGRVESVKCLVAWPRDHAYYNRNGWAGALSVDGVAVNDSPYNNAVARTFIPGIEEHLRAAFDEERALISL